MNVRIAPAAPVEAPLKMVELNHFRNYEIAQAATGAPLELARKGERVVCLGFDTVRRRFVEINALGGGDGGVFLERAAAVAAQSHRALAPVVDYGSEADVPFYATDLIDGEEFSRYVSRVKAVPPEAACAWLLAIAEAASALAKLGLTARVDSARLCWGRTGRVEARVVDFGISDETRDHFHYGAKFADYLRRLCNYQDEGEEPVYPPEVGPLAALLEEDAHADECAEILRAAGAPDEAPALGEGLRPRLSLEREMFQRERPEHVLPERYRPRQRVGEQSPYLSTVDDGESGGQLRILVFPPERMVSENFLEIFEHPQHDLIVGVAAFWKHEDFRLLAEEMRPGFSLGDWLGARRSRGAEEVVVMLDRVAQTVAELAEAGRRSRDLHPDDVLVEFEGVSSHAASTLCSGVELFEWPEFRLRVRTHATMRSLTASSEGQMPNGADTVFESAGRGERLPARDVFAWYFNLRNRGLAYQADELIETLRDAVLEGGGAARAGEPGSGALEDDEDDEPIISPIAAAMGVVEEEEEEEAVAAVDPELANPIARQVVLGAADADPELVDELVDPQRGSDEAAPEPDEIEALPFALPGGGGGRDEDAVPPLTNDVEAGGRPVRDIEDLLDAGGGRRRGGSGLVMLLFILITAVVIAAAVAHLTGRAFWLKP